MFCKNCGAQISDNAKFCGVCGASQAETAAPATTAAPANSNSASASAGAAINLGAINLKDIVKYIAVGVAVLALIFAIMNIFSTYDVKATISALGQKGHVSYSLKELNKMTDGKFTMASVGNILFGIVNLVIVAVGVLYFLKENNKMDLYDKYIAKYTKGKSALFVVGVLGAAGALLQIVLYMLCKAKSMGASMTIGNHWTTWFALFLYAGCAALDFFVLNPKKK